MKSNKILLVLCLIIGTTLMVGSGLNMYVADLNLPDFFVGTSGVSVAVMSFASVTMPQTTGYEDGDENMGGFGVVAYLALHSDIATWPQEYTDPNTLEKMVKLHGNFAMVAQKYFLKIMVPADTLSNDPEGQGEIGGRSFKNKGKFFIPGFDGENRGLARRLNNSRGVIIIPTDDGYRLMIGSENRPVQFMPSGKSGMKAADAKGFEYSYENDSFAPGYTYNGSIPLSGSTIAAVS